MAKLNLESAFKHILVNKDQWDLLGFTLKCENKNGHLQTLYYVNTCLIFGLQSVPELFDMYVRGLEYITFKNGSTFVCHDLDDSFTVAKDQYTKSQELVYNVKNMHRTWIQCTNK